MAEPDTIETTEPIDRYDPDRVALDRHLTERVTRAHATMTTALSDILAAITEAEDAESYWAQGSQTSSEWLAANLGIHGKTARMWSRMAEQLREFPAFRERMASGELNVDQVRELLKYVGPEDHAEIAASAVFDSAEDLEAIARAERRVSRERVKEQRAERYFIEFFDHEEMTYSFRGEIPGPDGLVVHRAMQLLAWNAPEEPVYELPRHPEHLMADAFVEMASNALANTSDHDIATVVVHARADELQLDDRVGTAEFGFEVPMEIVRRLTCDGRIQLVAHADDDGVLGIGRVDRTIPAWLRRLIRDRDGGCRFPGCRRTFWTQIHHMIHWAHGGPTDLDNLVTLCGHHHRMLHEDQWTVRGDPAGELEWLLPGGTRFHRRPGRRSWEIMRDLDLEHVDQWVETQPHLVKPGPG